MPYGSRKVQSSKLTLARLRTALNRVNGKGRKVAKKAYGNARSLAATSKVPFAKRLGGLLQIDKPLRSRGAFPATLWTQHRYTEVRLLNADNTTGRTGSEAAYNLGSLYSPRYSGGGHQPMGFDQMIVAYHNYVVYKVDIQVRIVEAATSGGKAFVVCNKRASTDTYNLSGVKSAEECQEQPNNTLIDADEGVTWNTTLHNADIEGKPRSAIFTENSYTGSATGNPTANPYFSMACGTYDEPGGASSWVRVMVSFVFHVRWTNPLSLGQS